MVKNSAFNFDKFSQQIDHITKLNDFDFQKISSVFNELNKENDKILSKIINPFGLSDDNNDRANKLIKEIIKSNNIKSQSKGLKSFAPSIEELESRLEKLKGPTPSIEELESRLEKLKGPTPSIEELESRLEKLDDKSIKKNTFKSNYYNTAKELLNISLGAQANICKTSIMNSKNLEEKNSLTVTAGKLFMFNKLLYDTGDISEDNGKKILTIFAKGLSKFYNGIKNGVSVFLDKIKSLGEVLVKSIESFFNDNPEKQLENTKNNLKGLYQNLVDLKGVNGVVKEKFLQKHFLEIDRLERPEQIFHETVKVTKAIRQVNQNKMAELKVKGKRFSNKNKSFSPVSTPKVSKSNSNSLKP